MQYIAKNDCILRQGATLGVYEVIKLLSCAGIGELYLVKNSLTGKRYVLKLLPPLSPADEEDFESKYKEDIQFLQEHTHKNIVNVKSIGFHRDILNYCYIVMEYVESAQGRPVTLQDRLKFKKRLPEVQVKKIALQVCSALDYAHNFRDRGLFHSNLKPANILFDLRHNVKVSEFETLKFVGNDYFSESIRHCMNISFDHGAVSQSLTPGGTSDTTDQNIGDGARTSSFILLNDDKKLKMADFGITKLINSDYVKEFLSKSHLLDEVEPASDSAKQQHSIKSKDDTLSSTQAGTNHSILESYDYMSPEQKAGYSPSQASNIYSIGLIIYRMLTGEKMTSCWNLPSTFGCNSSWDAIIIKCLKPEPEERYQSVEYLIEDIREVATSKERFVFGGKLKTALIVVAVFILLMLGGFAMLNLSGFRSKGVAYTPSSIADFIKQVFKPSYDEYHFQVIPAGATVVLIKDDTMVDQGVSYMDGAVLRAFPGRYNLLITYSGYKSFQKEITLGFDERRLYRFSLAKHNPEKTKEYLYLSDLSKPTSGHPWIIPEVNIEMLPVDRGSFQYGSPEASELAKRHGDAVQHTETLSYDFWMGKYEITQSQYEEIMWKNPALFNAAGADAPVENVSWEAAKEFCIRLTRVEKKNGRLPEGYVYRLPTEKEWEYCCRAGSENWYCFGNDAKELDKYGWFIYNSSSTTDRVGMKAPNRWGFYDMHGNVWEWCRNYEEYIANNDKAKRSFILRGGSWSSTPEMLRCVSRISVKSKFYLDSVTGFRIVCAPPFIDPN